VTDILTDPYWDPPVYYQISAYDADGNRVDVDYTDLFDLVLEKLGGSPCGVKDAT
jgi:hypothetical protein